MKFSSWRWSPSVKHEVEASVQCKAKRCSMHASNISGKRWHGDCCAKFWMSLRLQFSTGRLFHCCLAGIKLLVWYFEYSFYCSAQPYTLPRRFIQTAQESVALSALTALAVAHYISKESLEGLCEQLWVLYTPCWSDCLQGCWSGTRCRVEATLLTSEGNNSETAFQYPSVVAATFMDPELQQRTRNTDCVGNNSIIKTRIKPRHWARDQFFQALSLQLIWSKCLKMIQ